MRRAAGRAKTKPPVTKPAGLISIYLVGEDKSSKNVIVTTESTILLALMLKSSVLTLAMFLLLDKFWATSKLKSIGAS